MTKKLVAALDWLTDRVNEGRGALFLAITEDGDIGLFRDMGEEAGSIGHGDTVAEALCAAYERRGGA